MHLIVEKKNIYLMIQVVLSYFKLNFKYKYFKNNIDY